MTNATSNQTRRPPWMPAGVVQWSVLFGIGTLFLGGVGAVRVVDGDINNVGVQVAQVDQRAMENARGVEQNRRRIEDQRRRTDDIAVKQGGVLGAVRRLEQGQDNIESKIDRLILSLQPPPSPVIDGRNR